VYPTLRSSSFPLAICADLDAAQQDASTTKILELQHGSRGSLDRPMILLNELFSYLLWRTFLGVSHSALKASSATKFAPLFIDCPRLGFSGGRVCEDGLAEW
jgi:hypothetical protein